MPVEVALDHRQPLDGIGPFGAELEAIVDGWRPYRTWVAVLLRRVLEDRAHEIAA